MPMSFWIGIIFIAVVLLIFAIAWWTLPDGLEEVRQRERAMKAMRRWSG